MHDRPTITSRGWLVLTLLGMVLGAGIGLALTPGNDPCEWATVGVECAP